ncbi:MAG: PD-(D/E)XK nuclease family protein [Chthoniobacteraceae bacterium]
MPSARLHLYRFIEDAWAGGLRAWCEGGGESWLLVENAGQSRWLSRKFAAAGIEGARIFDADGLRDEMARLAGVAAPPRHLAMAAFVAKVAERQAGAPAARNVTALVEACDALSRAGWHLNQLALDPAVARRVHRAMERAAILPGIFERRLHEPLPPLPARLCCIGWDATHWPDLGLLDLAVSKASAFEMYVPSPRLPADTQQQVWIEALENRFKLERVTCPQSGFASENEPLVARLDNSRLTPGEQVRAPGLLVGREWPDQVRLARDQIVAWLAENPAPGAPFGIVAPEDSATAIAVAEALVKAGVKIERGARSGEPGPAQLILEQIARYHLSGHDIEELLELIRLLRLRQPGDSPDPEWARDALDRAFRAAQSRNARILAQAQPKRTDAAWTAIRDLVDALGRWDVDFTWAALRKKWERLLAALDIPAGAFDPLPPDLFDDESIPGRAFMGWVEEELLARRGDVPPPDFAAPAQVVITTFANAAQQTFERLIFLDSNEGAWPAGIAENPFLPDAARLRLNGNRGDSGALLTTRDLRALDHARFLDLIEQCRGAIAFAGVLIEHSGAGDRSQPNQWVLRSLIETADGTLPFEQWASSAQACPPELSPGLEESERAHLELVHASRRDGLKPFDRYMFNFNETKLEPGAWTATNLDMAITKPATFALLEFFDVARREPFMRGEGAVVGGRAHAWLGRILGVRDHLAPPGDPAGDEAKLKAEFAAARRELEEWYTAEDLRMPIWWETCLRKTAWAARRCLREVRGRLDGRYCAMEQSLAVTVQTPRGPLPLKGRIDILISDRPEISGAQVRIFDFKTGRGATPTLTTLGSGNGAQFAAYYLMARDAGAAEAIVGIIKPEERAREIFTPADEEVLRAHFGLFAEMRHTFRFGRLGPLVDERGKCEELPMATAPIDPAILEQKAGLLLLA